MLIEQIIEFELRGPEPPGRICSLLLKTGYFHDKTKMLKANLQTSELVFAAKNIAEGNVPCYPTPRPSHLQNITQNARF